MALQQQQDRTVEMTTNDMQRWVETVIATDKSANTIEKYQQ